MSISSLYLTIHVVTCLSGTGRALSLCGYHKISLKRRRKLEEEGVYFTDSISEIPLILVLATIFQLSWPVWTIIFLHFAQVSYWDIPIVSVYRL